MSKTPKKEESKSLEKKKEYTDEEKALIAKYKEQIKSEPLSILCVETDGDKRNINFNYSDSILFNAKLMEATGTVSKLLSAKLLSQISNADGSVTTDESKQQDKFSYDLALMAGIKPNDTVESMLAVQMIATHDLAMEFIRRAMLPDRQVYQVDNNINRATKMLRSFTAQVEALNKYRNKGQQKVTVEHVTINEGGQAVVGVVEHKGGGSGGDEKN